MTDRPDLRVVQCNIAAPTKVATRGSRAYLVRLNPGGGDDRIVVLVRSRGRRFVQKWENIKNLTDFRVKTVPPEHPMYHFADLIDRGDEAAVIVDQLYAARLTWGGW